MKENGYNKDKGKYILPLFAFLFFLGIWHITAVYGGYTSYQLPGPSEVFIGIWDLISEGVLYSHVTISLYRFGIAFILAVFAGVFMGILIGWYTFFYKALDPFIQILRPISPIAWFPLAVLWFKVGNPPAIFIIFMAAIFPILLSTASAVRGVDPVYLKVSRNFGTREVDTLKKVVVPAAFPGIMIGLHIALGTAWIHLVAGEMLGAQSGVGFMIIDARNFLRTDLVIAGMIIIGLLGLLLDKLMGWAENKVKRVWGYQ